MSSSRIIRQESGRPYRLEPLGGVPLSAQREAFRPVRLGSDEAPEAEPAEVEAPAPPPMMTEEQAHAMIREARAEGVREGREQAEAEFAAAAHALAEGLAEVASLQPRILHDVEEDVLRLAVLIARKVMLREFACDPAILAEVVAGAVELASDGGEVVVRLNPDEYAVVADCAPFLELLRENPRISLKPDPAVGRAGCLLETTRGNIDAGVEAQLDEIMRRLMEEKSARREEDALA